MTGSLEEGHKHKATCDRKLISIGANSSMMVATTSYERKCVVMAKMRFTIMIYAIQVRSNKHM